MPPFTRSAAAPESGFHIKIECESTAAILATPLFLSDDGGAFSGKIRLDLRTPQTRRFIHMF